LELFDDGLLLFACIFCQIDDKYAIGSTKAIDDFVTVVFLAWENGDSGVGCLETFLGERQCHEIDIGGADAVNGLCLELRGGLLDQLIQGRMACAIIANQYGDFL
jgi:hypothetical protein